MSIFLRFRAIRAFAAGSRYFVASCTALAVLIAAAAPLNAQDTPAVGKTVQTEGISGYVDAHRRSPLLSFRVENTESSVKILVDTAITNDEFKDFPVQVDFYVNRELYRTQMRSIELPGPLGIEVPATFAAPPFNFSIVATLLHPNRQYITVAHGAAFASDLIASVDCSVTILSESDDAEDKLYVANNVQTSQSGNDSFVLNFEASEATSGETLKFDANVALGTEINVDDEDSGDDLDDDDALDDDDSDDDLGDDLGAALSESSEKEVQAATARLATTTASLEIDGSSSTSALTGDVSFDGDAVSAIDLESSDGNIIVNCQ